MELFLMVALFYFRVWMLFYRKQNNSVAVMLAATGKISALKSSK